MVLSDVDIRKELDKGALTITPLDENAIQPCSIDLHLDPSYRRFQSDSDNTSPIDLSNLSEEHTTLYANTDNAPIVVQPGECVLMSTLESVGLDETLAAQVDGKSSLGRLFQSVHITAGWIDAGFIGQITLEVVNHTHRPFIYHPFMPIAQLVVQYTSSPVERTYAARGHYHGQIGPVESKYKVGKRALDNIQSKLVK